jgi:nicotinamidase-related amidase
MKALVIVDMLDDFVTGALANPHAERILDPLARLLAHARASEDWVVV